MWSRTALTRPELKGVVAPTLVIGREAWNMMQAYVQGVQAEVNGFGYISRGTDGTFHWLSEGDVFITHQVVTMGTADNTGSDVAKALYRAGQDGRQDEFRLQWHSHVNGDAYHSGTDMATIEGYGLAGVEWWVSVVTNKHGDITARLDVFRPHRIGVPLRVVLVDQLDKSTIDRAEREIAQLVTVQPLIEVKQPRRRKKNAATVPAIQG